MKSSLGAESLSGAESVDRHQAQQLFQLHNQTETGLLWHEHFFLWPMCTPITGDLEVFSVITPFFPTGFFLPWQFDCKSFGSIILFHSVESLVWINILEWNVWTEEWWPSAAVTVLPGWSIDLVCSRRCSLAFADWDKTVAKSCKSTRFCFCYIQLR